MMRFMRNKGQGLIETTMALPVLLIILAGGYVCCRSSFLISAAETAARDEALRIGRGFPGNEDIKSDAIIQGGEGVIIRTVTDGKSRILPFPFPALAGRTKGIVEIRKSWEESGGFGDLPQLGTTRPFEASVDCWEMKSSSGKKLSGFVKGYVITGILR